jgi:hypothetical protein
VSSLTESSPDKAANASVVSSASRESQAFLSIVNYLKSVKSTDNGAAQVRPPDVCVCVCVWMLMVLMVVMMVVVVWQEGPAVVKPKVTKADKELPTSGEGRTRAYAAAAPPNC